MTNVVSLAIQNAPSEDSDHIANAYAGLNLRRDYIFEGVIFLTAAEMLNVNKK